MSDELQLLLYMEPFLDAISRWFHKMSHEEGGRSWTNEAADNAPWRSLAAVRVL